MASRLCVFGCGRFLASSDGHERCVSCLGYQHADAALVDESCCGPDASSSNEGVSPSPCPFLVPPSLQRGCISPNSYGDLRITVRVPQWPAAVITPPPVAAPPPPRRRGHPPAAPSFAPVRPQQQPSLRQQCGAGSRKMAQPVSAPARPVKCQGKQHSWDGRIRDTGSSSSRDGESAPSPGGGPGENLFFPFWVVLPLALRPVLVSSRPNLQSSFLCFQFPRGRGR